MRIHDVTIRSLAIVAGVAASASFAAVRFGGLFCCMAMDYFLGSGGFSSVSATMPLAVPLGSGL